MAVVNGITLNSPDIPAIAKTMAGRLLVIGCAGNYLEDMRKYKYHGKCHYMAINDQIERLNLPVLHAVSLHTDCLIWWSLLRRSIHTMKGWFHTHSDHIPDEETYGRHSIPAWVWETKWQGGSSSLLGVVVGLAMGYEEIVLAGVPLDTSAGNCCHAGLPHPYECFLAAWEEANREVFNGRVKSLSGNTRELLGEPS